MATLSNEQTEFLRTHGIALARMFDASGMRTKDYDRQMKAIGKDFAFGVVPCRRFGHSLRTRKGACIQCHPASITFMNRESRTAFVYVAHSRGLGLVKIGHSADPEKRIYDGNCAGYGGARDWTVLATARVGNAPEIERAVQARLSEHSVPSEYFMGEKLTASVECFRCGYPEARSALRETLAARGHPDAVDLPDAARYRF